MPPDAVNYGGMESVILQSDRVRLVIRPDLGAGISDFSVKGPANFFHPLMRRSSDGETNPSNLACFVMAPWANRIGGAMLSFAGANYKLKATSSDGSAIHGDVRARSFAVLDRSPVSARFGFDSRGVADVNYPFPFEVIVRYEVQGLEVRVQVVVGNVGENAMPAGCGIHPYFMRRLWADRDVVRISAPVWGRYELANRLATKPAKPERLAELLRQGCELPGEAIDAVFGGCDGAMTIAYPASGVVVKMDGGSNQRQVVLFVPHVDDAPGSAQAPLPYFALEPQTNVNDGFNLVERGAMTAADAGMVLLKPGERLVTETVFTVGLA